MPVINTGKAYRLGTTTVQRLYAGTTRVWPPTPVITSVSPTEYHHADAVQQMTINGSGFLPTSQVLLNGVVQGTFVYVSPTQVKANVDPSNTGTADLSWPVIVRTSGIDSAAKNITVVPEPTLTSISPTQRETDDPTTTFTLTGTNFTPECKVMAGSGVMTGSTYVNRTTMTCIDGQNTVTTVTLHVEDEKAHKSGTKTFNIVAPPTPTVTSASGYISEWSDDMIYLTGTNFKAPMTCNLQKFNSTCQISESYAIGSTSGGVVVDSPTTAHIVTVPYDGHYSTASPDSVHNVRVTTPDGTSPWCTGQPIGVY